MNAPARKPPNQALTVQQQVRKAFNSEKTEADLTAMAAASVSITAITNEAGYEQVKRAHLTLRNARVEVEKTGKAARDEALKVQRAVLEEERRLIAIVSPEEDRLAALRQAVDDEIERKRQERIEAERQRAIALQGQITNLEKLPATVAGKSAEQIAAVVLSVRAMVVNEDTFAEFTDRARESQAAVVERLEEMFHERTEFEGAQAQLAEQRRLQALEQERLDRERAEREERDRQERERAAALRAEEERKAKVEAERLAQEQRLKRDEEERERAAERQRLADEQERIDREKRELEAQRAAFEREREAAMAPPPSAPPPLESVISSEAQALAGWLPGDTVVRAPVASPEEQSRAVELVMRPPFGDMIEQLASYYAVPAGVVVDWLASYFRELSGVEVES